MSSISVTDVDLSVADEMKILGMVFDCDQLTLHNWETSAVRPLRREIIIISQKLVP